MTTEKKRILIIENHPDNGRILTDYFRAKNYQAIWTSETGTVLQHCQIFKPDIIVMEMRLAGITGIDLLKELQRHSDLKKISVICISSDTTQWQIDLAKSIGAAAFLIKPLKNEIVGNLVATLCNLSDKQRALTIFSCI